jgi:MoaA/NifB/PqqE/SkfB family radical SAM enzyme
MTATLDNSANTVAVTTFLWLEITGKCQLNCEHCYADSGPEGDHGSMTLEDWRRVIDQAAAVGVREAQFIGGEPTLHEGLADMVMHALRRGMLVEVFSNLVHVTDELWHVFSLPGVRLATSYYSDDAGQHKHITRRPTHARTQRNIAMAAKRGIPLRAGVIDLGGGQRVAEAREQLVHLGVPEIGYHQVQGIGRAGCGEGPAAPELCGRCGDRVAAVMPDGTVRPCIMSRWMDVGNVRFQSLATALQAMPTARESLIAQGMQDRSDGSSDCPPQGQDCYPHNRFANAGADCPPQGQNRYPHNQFARASGGDTCPPEGAICNPNGGTTASSDSTEHTSRAVRPATHQ